MQCYVMIELTTVLYLGPFPYPLLHLLLTDVETLHIVLIYLSRRRFLIFMDAKRIFF